MQVGGNIRQKNAGKCHRVAVDSTVTYVNQEKYRPAGIIAEEGGAGVVRVDESVPSRIVGGEGGPWERE